MNKMLVVAFDNEKAADAGSHALRKLHDEGDITLYAMAVLARDSTGKVSVTEAADGRVSSAGMGLAVGALVGLMVGPVGLAVGAVTGALAGAIRDLWIAGVDLDFVEEAQKMLLPGKVALVAEVDEEWVVPVDSALEACGGTVFRRARSEVVDAQFNQSIAVCKGEIAELEAEAAHATGTAKSKLQTQLAASKAALARAVQMAKQRMDALKLEADGKAHALKEQLSHATGEVRGTIEDRIQRVKSAFRTRGAELSHAWGLAKAEVFV